MNLLRTSFLLVAILVALYFLLQPKESDEKMTWDLQDTIQDPSEDHKNRWQDDE